LATTDVRVCPKLVWVMSPITRPVFGDRATFLTTDVAGGGVRAQGGSELTGASQSTRGERGLWRSPCG
jgi:hypothetical protein